MPQQSSLEETNSQNRATSLMDGPEWREVELNLPKDVEKAIVVRQKLLRGEL